VLGAETQPLWLEVADFLRPSLPQVEERTIDGVGHLLHVQRPEPVARAMAQFLKRNTMARKPRHLAAPSGAASQPNP
jgi:pimeloyl-ACP methyl ester carboxylesterase